MDQVFKKNTKQKKNNNVERIRKRTSTFNQRRMMKITTMVTIYDVSTFTTESN